MKRDWTDLALCTLALWLDLYDVYCAREEPF
jgi:hypothetical protein